MCGSFDYVEANDLETVLVKRDNEEMAIEPKRNGRKKKRKPREVTEHL